MYRKLKLLLVCLLVYSNVFSKSSSVSCMLARQILPEEFLDKYCLCGEFTDLHMAVINGDKSEVRKLVESGVRVDVKNSLGETAFMTAVRHNRPDIAQILKNAGADVDAEDKDGRSALDWARSVGHHKMVKFLKREIAFTESKGGDPHRAVSSVR